MLIPAYPVERLKGADYNPRRIDEEGFARLLESVRALGVVKPIIATRAVVVAGHQRTKALKALGVATAPVYLVDGVSQQDEIRFNQLHNATDADGSGCRVPPGEPGRFEDVPPEGVAGDMRQGMAIVRQEIGRLVLRYGPWGAAVADAAGAVIHGDQYALACKALGVPCRVFRVADGEAARRYLGAQYGRFSYDHLPRQTWAQAFAQMHRLSRRENSTGVTGVGRDLKSRLYEDLVIPHLEAIGAAANGVRVLDFGCGEGGYVRMLRRRGVDIIGLEFYPKRDTAIDTAAAHRMVDETLASLRDHGPFDVVVCDSVLNSVDSLQAEADVMTCISAFCRPSGVVFFSGRKRERCEAALRHSYQKNSARYVEFLDDDGFSATFRAGVWTYQKFHTAAEAEALATRYVGPVMDHVRRSSTSWQIAARRMVELPREQVLVAVRREFDLPWPMGRAVKRSEEASAAVQFCGGLDGAGMEAPTALSLPLASAIPP